MAYQFTGADPSFKASIGAMNGYALRNGAGGGYSGAALLKRRAVSAWHSIYIIDEGNTTNHEYLMEFNPSNQLIGATGAGATWTSTATFNDTTNWMIVGFTWDGTTSSGGWQWRYKIGSGAWTAEAETATTDASAPTTLGSGYRHVIGIEAASADDADYDMTCIGAIKGALSQATFESLTMTDIASWDAVFTGANAWLIGFQDISSRTDRTGNGGNEVSRSAGITVSSDPAGWSWGGGGGVFIPTPTVVDYAVPRAASW